MEPCSFRAETSQAWAAASIWLCPVTGPAQHGNALPPLPNRWGNRGQRDWVTFPKSHSKLEATQQIQGGCGRRCRPTLTVPRVGTYSPLPDLSVLAWDIGSQQPPGRVLKKPRRCQPVAVPSAFRPHLQLSDKGSRCTLMPHLKHVALWWPLMV